MKAKMTVYQAGGKMPIDPKKQELAKKLFGAMPKYNKEEFRYGMMGEKMKELKKEYDYWVNKGERTAASGVKVQMDAVKAKMEDLKGKIKPTPEKKSMFKGGGKMNVAGATNEDVYKYMGYGMGGKMKKYLTGGQVKLDVNKDGKISGVDFKMLKNK
jgi:hypothetical protein